MVMDSMEVVSVIIELIDRLMLLMMRMKVMFIDIIISGGMLLESVMKVVVLRKFLFRKVNIMYMVSKVVIRFR